jgi:hypothetical protein
MRSRIQKQLKVALAAYFLLGRLKWVPGRSRRKFKIADVVSEP